MLPVLERLLYKPKQAPVTRVLVLTPTRELAVQIHQVSRQLAQFTNVDISLSAGIYQYCQFVDYKYEQKGCHSFKRLFELTENVFLLYIFTVLINFSSNQKCKVPMHILL